MGREGKWIASLLGTLPYTPFLLFQLPKSPVGIESEAEGTARGSVEEVSWDSIPATCRLLKSLKIGARTLAHLITQVLTTKSNTQEKRHCTPPKVYTFQPPPPPV